MKVLVIGAGAVGLYLGGRLAASGNTVCFIARPDVEEALRSKGLRLELPRLVGPTGRMAGAVPLLRMPEFRIAASVSAAVRDATFDAALFAVKTYHVPQALGEISAVAARMPPLLCLTNGVEAEDRIAEVLGRERVIAGALTTAVQRKGPGHVATDRERGVGLAAGHGASQVLCGALRAAGMRARLYADHRSMKWSKLLTNLLVNPTAAILDMRPAEILAHSGLFTLEMRVLRECLAVMRAGGTHVLDLPGVPVRLLAAISGLPTAISRWLLLRAVGEARGTKMPSLHIDLHSGRGKSEVGELHGALARFGAQCGVDTPASAQLTSILLALTRGDLPVDEFAGQPDKLLAAIDAGGR